MRLTAFWPLVVFLLLAQGALAWSPTHKLETERGTLFLRPLEDKSLLFAFRPEGSSWMREVPNSPLWDHKFITTHSDRARTADLKLGESLSIDGGELFFFVNPGNKRLTLEVRYQEDQGDSRRIAIEFDRAREPFSRILALRGQGIDHLYGLGEQFPEHYLGQTRTDWRGRIRHAGVEPDSFLKDPIGVYGNSLTPLAGGSVANALFPVLHMASETGTDAVLFLDNAADSQWDFTAKPWSVNLRHGELGGALAWGEEAEVLRSRYLEWTGRPPVPPRKAFGLWVSEYGYENWDQVTEKADALQQKGFPVDGFVLDLQWFGGIITGSPDSSMGKLTFDTENFPDPAGTIAKFAQRGLGIITIEESYIASNLDEFADLADREYLVRAPDPEPEDPDAPKPGYRPHIIDRIPWWGIGSMIDYTNREAADYWHKTKRADLIKLGVMGHWTDLGEPEIFRHVVKGPDDKVSYLTPIYHGGKEQLEVNNLFGLHWAESIFRGYGEGNKRKGPRPFILSRTGTSGIQRYGTSLWSGDIGANWESLRSHYVAQGHMAYSGVDYYGSDVGGFYRAAFKGTEAEFDELYTRWLAAACLTDIPLRPHTMNLGKNYETSPDRVGHIESNLANLKLRYRLIPYLYSAAFRAWVAGEPVVAPIAIEPDQGGELATSGTLKRIGKDLLAQLVLEPGQDSVSVPLPAGGWYDFYSGDRVSGPEATVVKSATVDAEGRLRTPLFARAGAVIPVGSEITSEADHTKLELYVFPGYGENRSWVYHDDGKTEGYRAGEYAATEIEGKWRIARYGDLTIKPVEDRFVWKLPDQREVILNVASPERRIDVFVNGEQKSVEANGNFWRLRLPAVDFEQGVTLKFR